MADYQNHGRYARRRSKMSVVIQVLDNENHTLLGYVNMVGLPTFRDSTHRLEFDSKSIWQPNSIESEDIICPLVLLATKVSKPDITPEVYKIDKGDGFSEYLELISQTNNSTTK
jgi:hypothetical protein